MLSKVQLPFDWFKRIPQDLSPFIESLVYQRLVIQVEEVKSEYGDLILKVFLRDMLSGPVTQCLKWQYLLLLDVVGHQLTVHYVVLDVRRRESNNILDYIRI